MVNKYSEIINTYLSKTRVKHSRRVASVGKELAHIYSANEALVHVAGLLHDIAKHQTPETLQNLGIDASEHDECWHKFPAVWHAFVGPKLIHHIWPEVPSDIDPLVVYHTTGKANMDLESAIVFVADFIEPERIHHQRLFIENVAKTDLNAAIAWITHYGIQKLRAKNAPIHPLTLECWDYYCNYIIDSEEWPKDEVEKY